MDIHEAFAWYDRAIDNAIDYLNLDREEQNKAWNVIDKFIDEAIASQSATSEEVQEAIELFEGAIKYRKEQEEETKKHYGGRLPDFYLEINKKEALAITALQAYQPWIPVSNPPTEFGDYLVLVKYYKGAKQIKIDVAEWYDEWKINYEWTITHWKPLPEPPKGE